MDPKESETPRDGDKRTADQFVDVVYDDGPGDTTVVPAGPEIPRDWPRPHLPPRPHPPNGGEGGNVGPATPYAERMMKVIAEDQYVTILYDDGPGDTTVRPMSDEIPREWPRPQLPPRPSPPNGEE